MLKKIILFGILLLSVVITTYVLAQEDISDEASPSAITTTVDTEKIKALKEKLATKVAELRENQTRGFYGEIATLNKSSFTLATTGGEIKIRYNEDSLVFKLTQAKKSEAKPGDLKNTLSASVLGIYESDLNQLTAKIVILQTLPKFLSGEVNEIDKSNAVITLSMKNGDKVNLDYEKSTQAFEYKKEDANFAKSGLSRITLGDRLYVWWVESEEDIQKLMITKLLRIPKEIFNGEGETSATKASPAPLVPKSRESSPSATPKTSPKTSPKAS